MVFFLFFVFFFFKSFILAAFNLPCVNIKASDLEPHFLFWAWAGSVPRTDYLLWITQVIHWMTLPLAPWVLDGEGKGMGAGMCYMWGQVLKRFAQVEWHPTA